MAAKQAWRRSETAQAHAKQPRGGGGGARGEAKRRASHLAAEAAEEARAAKTAWQEALAKAERGMEEAKKGLKRM